MEWLRKAERWRQGHGGRRTWERTAGVAENSDERDEAAWNQRSIKSPAHRAGQIYDTGGRQAS